MFNQDQLLEIATRMLSIPSNEQTGNEDLVRYLQTMMSEIGFKVQTQPIQHSVSSLSKRQFNLIAFSSDTLVDRTTRKGLLMINPLDVTAGNLPHLWSSTKGNPYAPVIQGSKLMGAGAVQGKIDFLCRVMAATELLESRHKVPLYLVGTGASHYGMLGSRFLIESLSVNPKEVITFSPTELKIQKNSPGHVSFMVEIESSVRDKDSRGYNRCINIQAFGLSVDFSESASAINAFELLMDLLMDASSNEFDFQWSKFETRGAEGANPDIAEAQIFLTAFQFEDFKQFIREKISEQDLAKFYRIDFVGVVDRVSSFFSQSMIEVILELDYEWKTFLATLNQSTGGLTQIAHQQTGKTAVRFEVRHHPQYSIAEIEKVWKEKVMNLFSKHRDFSFSLQKNRMVHGCLSNEPSQQGESMYASDAGWFEKARFPVKIMGIGSSRQLPKGPNEFIDLAQINEAIKVYREMILSACL